MTPERFEQVGRICDAALKLEPVERGPFVESACGADEELRREVESLLEADEQAGDFIARPALGMAAELLEGGLSPLLPPGHVISHYRVLSPLGAGGMGEVYLAEDTRLGRKVALKLLLKEFTGDPERVRRFELEARAASALNHPSILTIYEIGRAGGAYFIATEYIEGETLRDHMAQGRMALPDALDVAAQVAGALDVAHSEGVVHRDVKPENIMLRRRDRIVKVLDFGLTKLTEKKTSTTRGPSGPSSDSTYDTQPGLVLGTVHYMSPEQTRGSAQVDHRADIWSLGVVLYEMVTGRAPFEGEDVHHRIVSIRESEPPPLGLYAEGVPERLEGIVRKALAKDPGERYQSAQELLVDLRSLRRGFEVGEELERSSLSGWANTSGAVRGDAVRLSSAGAAGHGPPVSSAGAVAGEVKGHRRGLLIALAAAVVLTAGAGFWVYRRLGRGRPSDSASAPAPKIIPLTSYPGVETEPSFSPDGRQIAFTWNGPGGDNYDVYVKLLDAGDPLRLTSHSGEDRAPCWSPDGSYIAFIRSTKDEDAVALLPALGGAERILHSVTPPGRSLGRHLSWSADGKSLAFSEGVSPQGPFSIYLLSVETLERRRLTSPPAGARGDGFPALSPDGKTLAFTRRSSNDKDEIYLAPAGGGEPARLTSDNAGITGLAWTRDGREIVFSSTRAGTRHLWRVPAAGGTPERVPAGEENPNALAVARQGRLLAYASADSDTNIWRIDVRGAKGAGGGPPVKLISSTRTDSGPQYSPDGRKIVFTSSRSGNLEVWMCDADGSNPIRLTSFGGPHVGTPRWSPDGRHVAFDSPAEGSRDVYVLGAGGGRPRRLTTEPSADVRPSWSRDGRFVYFGSNRGGDWQVWKAPAEGGPAVQVTKRGGREAFESPDGAYVYYTKENVLGLWRVPAGGGEEVKLLDQVISGAWVVWEQGVYFANPEAPLRPSIEFYSFNTERTTRVATIEKALFWSGPSLAATADGRWILYVQTDQTESDIMLVENFS
ncbi:MAG TPA: protein kinase [Pyrinomonadaceae bacterium]|nr:protein kinase [Pyrinomonadaceae bacterium]